MTNRIEQAELEKLTRLVGDTIKILGSCTAQDEQGVASGGHTMPTFEGTLRNVEYDPEKGTLEWVEVEENGRTHRVSFDPVDGTHIWDISRTIYHNDAVVLTT